jgi:hypothetical protein
VVEACVLTGALSSFGTCRIWNGSLVTMFITIEEKR